MKHTPNISDFQASAAPTTIVKTFEPYMTAMLHALFICVEMQADIWINEEEAKPQNEALGRPYKDIVLETRPCLPFLTVNQIFPPPNTSVSYAQHHQRSDSPFPNLQGLVSAAIYFVLHILAETLFFRDLNSFAKQRIGNRPTILHNQIAERNNCSRHFFAFKMNCYKMNAFMRGFLYHLFFFGFSVAPLMRYTCTPKSNQIQLVIKPLALHH